MEQTWKVIHRHTKGELPTVEEYPDRQQAFTRLREIDSMYISPELDINLMEQKLIIYCP